ncbi:ATPase family AAA domain-containing protein FIGL1-like [Cornus florida]|uniref:ATPase family AAA domain-containing protein FIGL1-like n=1 Tax=Cornus florida TaxID=4283 RepID=UPI0028A12FE9|nr:ATPase family AAA domain-containing protein FIGL1-like [Cornus florida]
MVIWPLLRPDIFKGCRSPGKGLLLFGPPGTGKTMIGKAIAGEAKATFFYISSSSVTSKWVGESEKLVRALFGVAYCRQPAVIFVDEIDSLLSKRKEGEYESYRRFKTQFLIEMEGFDSGSEQILLIGATNRPQELDEAARRRLTKRLYIPLPSSDARSWIIRNLLEKDGLFKLSKEDTDKICELTEGYSGSDMKNLVQGASMGPLREALKQGIDITKLKQEDMRPVNLEDFESAFLEVSRSVSLDEIGAYEEYNRKFGSLSF